MPHAELKCVAATRRHEFLLPRVFAHGYTRWTLAASKELTIILKQQHRIRHTTREVALFKARWFESPCMHQIIVTTVISLSVCLLQAMPCSVNLDLLDKVNWRVKCVKRPLHLHGHQPVSSINGHIIMQGKMKKTRVVFHPQLLPSFTTTSVPMLPPDTAVPMSGIGLFTCVLNTQTQVEMSQSSSDDETNFAFAQNASTYALQ